MPIRTCTRRQLDRLWISTLALGLGIGFGMVLPACGDDDGGVVPPTSLTRDQALHACVAADACGVITYAYGGSYCLETGWDQRFITATAPIWGSIFECVLDVVPDCDEVAKCFGGGAPLHSCSDITEGYCYGAVRVDCDTPHQTLIVQDCALANQTCTMANASMTDRVPKCGKGPCIEGQSEALCQDSLLLSCAGGNYEVTDCSVQGLVCGDGSFGGKACVGTGAGCGDTFAASCDGHVLTDCVNRKLRQLDCSTLPGNYTCSPVTNSCVAAGNDCTPGDPELCQGATIRMCVDGTWYDLDCADLGFTGCSVSPVGGAHCVP